MIKFGHKSLGIGCPAFIVAEMSANHLQDLNIALSLVDAAAASGADGFKIQTLTPDTMTIDCDNEYFRIKNGSPWDGKKLYDLYSETPFPYSWHEPIFKRCNDLGMVCFSTPYDQTAADFLEGFQPALYKIASFEIFDTQLIRHVASFGKPIVISTGIAGLDDIENAVQACRDAGNDEIILLKCTSAYPTPLEHVNLKTMVDMAERFGVMVGVSDHTLGDQVALASIPLGACFIEKHLTLSRAAGGPDASFSVEPDEFAKMVEAIRQAETILGEVSYDLPSSAKKNIIFARSLFFVKDIKAGDQVTDEHIRSIRPGYGLKPSMLQFVLGKRVRFDISRGTPTNMDMFYD